MTVIKFDKELVKKFPNLFPYIESRPFSNLIQWVINSKYRTAVNLKSWLAEQVLHPSDELVNFCTDIPASDDYDATMMLILKKIFKILQYEGDQEHWQMSEYWQTAQETIKTQAGDCEDGAILMYCMARFCGVPADRLLILCGDVKGGGHSWLAYRPLEYPLNMVFLDWCYYPSMKTITARSKFYINNQSIHEYTITDVQTELYHAIDSNYLCIWFAYNEHAAHYSLTFRES
jgi:predicted transglutaminase-like cysteine proteinase